MESTSSQTPPRRSGRPPKSPMIPKMTRGVVDHPLNKKESTAESASIRTPVSSAYTASLVQSAAKSVLDTSPSSTVSDDENSVEQPPSSPGLRSLLTKTVPAMPDDQDRKRFIVSLIGNDTTTRVA